MEDEGYGATEKLPESYKDAEKRKNIYSWHYYKLGCKIMLKVKAFKETYH